MDKPETGSCWNCIHCVSLSIDTWVCCAGRDNGDRTADLPYVDDSVIDCKEWEVE